MTDREKEIVMAYIRTHKLEGYELVEFHRYVEDIVGRPVSMDTINKIVDKNKKILEDAIMTLCKEDNSETKWIPVSEKLPEKACDCLVTIYSDSLFYERLDVVTCAYRPDLRSKWYPDDDSDDEIIAWMPLPKPYKKEED